MGVTLLGAADDDGLPVEQCPHHQCDAQVISALSIGRTRNTDVVLDAGRCGWNDGGRYALVEASNHAGRVTVRKLAHAGLAFGPNRLFRDHRDVCKAGTGRKTGPARTRDAA